jgi:hypothetical protein
MRTTIDINDALLKAIRRRADDDGRTFRRAINETLELGLAIQERAADEPRFQVKPHPLGIKPGFRGMSMNQLYDQIEAEQDASAS